MEIVNLKFLHSLLKISPVFLSSRSSKYFLRYHISKISTVSCHNRSSEYKGDKADKSNSYNFFRNDKKLPFNFDYIENEFIEETSEELTYSGIQKKEKVYSTKNKLKKSIWEGIELKPLKKHVYKYSPHVENQSTEEIENYRKLHNITLHGKNIPNPIIRISDYEFPEVITKTFKNVGVETATSIQSQGWPVILKGHDFIGIGQTGSGKTLAYVVPGLIHVFNQPPLEEEEGPIGLVIAPTRELVKQIHEVSIDMFTGARLRTTCMHGGCGVSVKNEQIISLRKWPHFCIATPGRLLDFLEIGATNLRRCSYLVLDEADMLLNMGFEQQLRRIIKQIRPDRQMIMCSATWPKAVQDLAHDFLVDFIQLNVGSSELYANPDIKQEFEVCETFYKRERVVQKLKEVIGEHEKILIFAETKVQVDFVVKLLNKNGLFAVGIHSDYHQSIRDKSLEGFRQGKYSILVATDVASRGIDVSDITLVMNYDFPSCIESYVHRIGRTGRAGKSGKALSFIASTDNISAVKDLIKLLERSNCEVVPSLYSLVQREKELKENKRKFRGFAVECYSRFRNKFK